MIDKIDRPEAPPAYFITRPKDAKESQHQQSDQRDEQEERFRQTLSEKGWTKYDKRERTIRALRAPREQIARCLFRGVFLHGGIGTLQIDVIWKDGRRTDGALVLLTRLEDYLRLRSTAPGQEVPDRYWARGATVEMGIIQEAAGSSPATGRPATAPKPLPPLENKKPRWFSALSPLDAQGKRIRWEMIAAYAVVAVALVGGLIALIVK